MTRTENCISNAQLVSIIMPAYNSAKFIGESITSALNQTYSNFELIVIDDGSTDDTSLEVTRIIDPRIKLITQENLGVAAARNNGIRHATGEFIAFLDSDDLWFSSKLEKQVSCFLSHPEVGLVFCANYCFKGDQKDHYFSAYSEPEEIHDSYIKLLTYDYISTLTVMVRRQIIDYFAPAVFDSDLFGTEDWDLWIRISKVTKVFKLDESLALYRIHANGISKNFVRHRNQEFLVLQKHVLNNEAVPSSVKDIALFIWERKHLAYYIKNRNYANAIQKLVFLIKRFGFNYTIIRLLARLRYGVMH